MISFQSKLIFFTVTNQHYFPGTIAALSSIRSFHPDSPIWVFSESRSPLTEEQLQHLAMLHEVIHLPAHEMPFGKVREAWQMKAHAARHLSNIYEGVIIQVDSDAVLCAPLVEIAEEVFTKQRPAGGKDGAGPQYPYAKYHHYEALCSMEPSNRDHRNLNYISSSVLFLPVASLREVFGLWSTAVDEAEFGPPGRDPAIYPGYGDQGVLNAILYFKGIEPIVLDSDLISQHWTHGRNPVRFENGVFWNGGKRQLAFHSVGDSPKFWAKEYIPHTEKKPNLKEVYLYWLYHLFDGPCGFLTMLGIRKLMAIRASLFPASSPDLLAEYHKRFKPALKRNVQSYGKLDSSPAQPLIRGRLY